MTKAAIACGAIALTVAASAADAGAATPRAAPRCTVLHGEKLPAASGGATALCSAIERAVKARGLKTRFTVRVEVAPRSMLMADITLAGGARLPTLHMAEMDRAITRTTLDRFGVAVADHIVSAKP